MKKVISILILVTFLCQDASFCYQEEMPALRVPLRYGGLKRDEFGEVKALVFDIGNVLIRWRPEVMARAMQKKGVPYDECLGFIDDYRDNGPKALFETGKIDFSQFVKEFNQQFKQYGVEVTPEEFRELWIKSLNGLNKELVEEIKRSRKKGFFIFFATNSNEVHVEEVMKKKYRLHELGNIVSSYHTGCLKKQPEFFSSHIVSNLELRPEDFLYFDDNTEYLEIASKSGIKPVFCDFEHTGSAVNLLRMIEKQKTTHLRLPRNKIKVKFKDGPHAKPSYAISDFVNKMRSFNFNIEHLYLSFAFAPNYKLDLLESDFCDGQDIMGFAILLYRAVDSRVMGPDQDLIFEFYGKPIRPLISLGVLMQAVLRRTEKSYKGDNAYGKGRYLDWLDNELRRVNEVSLLSFKEIMDKIRIEIESRQKEFIGAYCLEEKDPEDVLLHIVLGNSSLLQGFDMELSDFLYAKKSFKNTDVLKKTIGYLDSYVQYLKIFVEYRHPFSEYNEDALVEACCYSFVEYITSPEGAFEEFTESKYWKNIRPAFVSHVQFLDDRLNELKEISEILKRNAKLYSANAHRRNN